MTDKIKYYNMLCKIIKNLKNHSDSKWKEVTEQNPKEYRKALKTYNELITEKPPIRKEIIEKLANEYRPKEFFEFHHCNEYYYLPPIKGENSEYVAFLSFKFDYTDQNEEFCLRIGMRKIEDDEITKSINHYGVGFRYDTAHKKSDKHNYAHAQIVLKPLGEDLPNCPDWLPESLPCIPTPALDPISTILVMLISLYGNKEWVYYVSDVEKIEEYYYPLKRARIIN